MTFCRRALTAALLLTAAGADWPGFLGPARDGVSPETGLLASWPAKGPPRISLQFYRGPADAEHWARVSEVTVRRVNASPVSDR